MPAGLVHISKGTYKTNDTITVGSASHGCNLEGEGWWQDPSTDALSGTVIECQGSMADSINVAGNYSEVSNFTIDGNNVATQARSSGSYVTWSHINSFDHTTYSLNINGGNSIYVTGQCMFKYKPVRSTQYGVTFNGRCNFNGGAANQCLQIDGMDLTIRDCAFESYTTRAILIGSTITSRGVSVIGNYFETSYGDDCYAIIPYGVETGTISGNFDYTAAASGKVVLGFVLIDIAYNLIIEGNTSNLPVVVRAASGLSYIRGLSIKHQNGISFNTLTDLTSLNIDYNGGNTGRVTMWGDTTPTTGVWRVGDTQWRNTVVAGESPGVKVTTGGEPGTWVEMPPLSVE